MSFFEDASLVLIPSGYKASKVYSVKPTDGTGDLTFTRTLDTATRVGPDGLIEKVRTNLALQSNDFSNAAWAKIANASVSATRVADPFGGNTAWQIIYDGTANGRIEQTIGGATIGLNYSFSVFLRVASGTQSVLIGGGATDTTITLTTTWQRFTSISAAAFADVYPRVRCDDAVTIQAYGAQMEVSDFGATPYIPTTTAAVSVGMLANVPRLDYLGGGCPKLLLEPQRVNLVTFSEQINNAAWTKFRSSVTSNVAVSPAGFLDADKIIDNTENNSHGILQAVANTSGVQSSVSVFAKAAERSFLFISVVGGPSQGSFFDLSNGTIGSVLSNAPNARSIEDYGNGWYRCSITYTATDASSDIVYGPATANGVNVYTGDNTSGILLYGCQTEVGSYPTSYIPTLGAAVTRSADAASKTGISALLGGTQGTWFLEMKYQPVSSSTVSTMFVTGVSTIGLASSGVNTLRVRINAFNDIIASANPTNRHKIAISFDGTGVVCFFNGNEITLPNGASQVVSGLDQVNLETGTRHNDIEIFQMLYMQTRLSNADLASLTA